MIRDFFEKYLVDILAGGGGAAVVVFVSLKYFAKKILNQQFEKLIERYKLELNLEFDRVSKLNQKEFEVLPVIWEKIVNLRSAILFYSDPNKVVFQDLNLLNEIELKAFLDDLPIPSYFKSLIYRATEKNEMYKKVIENEGIEIMKTIFMEFDNIYKANKIFFTNKLLEAISDIHQYFHESIGVYINLPDVDDIKSAFRNDVDQKSKEKSNIISLYIKNRLRFHDE